MRRIIILSTIFALAASSSFAAIPKLKAGNRYEEGRTVAESHTTKHVAGREYTNHDTGESHRRILIYDKQSGEFKGYAKTGRLKGDATHRHDFR